MKKILLHIALPVLSVIVLMLTHLEVYAKEDPEIARLEKSLSRAKNGKDQTDIAFSLAQVCLKANSEKTEKYAKQAYQLATKNGFSTKAADAVNIWATYYYNNSNYKKAASKYEEEYELRKKLNQSKQLVMVVYNAGYCYSKQGNLRKCKKYYEESLALAKKYNMKDVVGRINKSMYEMARNEKKYQDAVGYVEEYVESENQKIIDENEKLQDLNAQNQNIIRDRDSAIVKERDKNNALTEVTAEQRLRIDNLALENENRRVELENQKLYLFVLITFSGFALLTVFLLVRQNRVKKRTAAALELKNKMIESQNVEISKNLEEIRRKNIDITDSLNYAGKIQKSLLTDFASYAGLMSGFFVFYAPKDIVSGDFYWGHKVDNKFVFTVGDCTGHSVPGAFMSMLGIALLNQIVVQQKILKASAILERMRSLVKSYLGQTGKNEDETKDGMDMSLCVWDLQTNQINYSGAYNPLYLVHEKELSVFNAEKCPVGIHTREFDFTDQYFTACKNDRLYLFSDGYSDQFGGPHKEKFKQGRFKKFLLETSFFPILRQKDKIEKQFTDWKGDFVQIDDVCVLGVEI